MEQDRIPETPVRSPIALARGAQQAREGRLADANAARSRREPSLLCRVGVASPSRRWRVRVANMARRVANQARRRRNLRQNLATLSTFSTSPACSHRLRVLHASLRAIFLRHRRLDRARG
jgi:hypothetical protein